MKQQTGMAHTRWRHATWRRSVALAGAVLSGAALAACGSSSSSTSSTAAATAAASSSPGVATAQAKLKEYNAAPTQVPVTTPLKSAPPAGKTVVMLGTNDPSNVIIQHSMEKLASLVHWNYSLVTYDPANPATFNTAIDTALSKHADYIAEAGLPLTSSAVAKVKAAGAKWVLAAVYPVTNSPTILSDSNDYSNDANMGKITAYYMIADSGGKANAVIEHVPAYPILDGFTNGFTSTVKSLCPSCHTQLANVSLPDLAAGKLPAVLVSALRSNSSANYLVFDDGPFADGVSSSLAAADLSKVKIIGEAVDQSGLAALKAGTEAMWTGYDPGYLAYTMFDSMLRDAEGMPINQAQEAETPTQVLTHANVGSATTWSQPANAQAQFTKLWHVS
jgi:ribose transport system substrate-binding protein